MTDAYDEKAREIAHRYTPRCAGGIGYGPGGDVSRYHTNSCDVLTIVLATALREATAAEREECAKVAERYQPSLNTAVHQNLLEPEDQRFLSGLSQNIAHAIRSRTP